MLNLKYLNGRIFSDALRQDDLLDAVLGHVVAETQLPVFVPALKINYYRNSY